MKNRRTFAPSLRWLYRRTAAPWKSRLDRRYLTREEFSVMLGRLHSDLSSVRSDSRDHRAMLDVTDRRVAESEILLDVLAERLAVLDADISSLRIQTVETRAEAAKGSAFVANEDPHGLRKRLFESNRLAREAAEAIESLLQAELLLWQKIDAADVERSESPLSGG